MGLFRPKDRTANGRFDLMNEASAIVRPRLAEFPDRYSDGTPLDMEVVRPPFNIALFDLFANNYGPKTDQRFYLTMLYLTYSNPDIYEVVNPERGAALLKQMEAQLDAWISERQAKFANVSTALRQMKSNQVKAMMTHPKGVSMFSLIQVLSLANARLISPMEQH